MKQLRNIMLGGLVMAFAACNDGTTTTNDSTTTTADTSAAANTTTTTTSTALAEKDAQFLSDVAASNMAEIKLAQLAQQKGNSQEVKDIAKMLETDHSAVLSDVKNSASQHSATLPTEEKEDAKDMYNKMNGKSGKEFDKDWCGHMIDMHKKSIDKFDDAQKDLTDAELKSWAGNTLPKLRTHLAKLEQCKANLK
jgi:putative membrane protein